MRETSNTLIKQNSQQPKHFRGGEKKVMKKSLSLLVAIAMVFSMFATVVSAAEVPNKPAGEYLNELGVIKGNGTDLKEDQTWKRQDIVVLLSRLLGQEEAAASTETTHEFTDVTNTFYDSYISWAAEEGLVQGKGNGKFGYNDELKNQEFYALVLRAFKLDVAYDDVPAKAVELELAEEGLDFAAIPTRGATYTSIVAALYTEVPGTGKTLGEVLGLIEIEAPAIAASAVGAKKLEVKFNKAVDTAAVKFAVKKGAATINIADEGVSFSADNKTATITLVNKLTEGDYTVTATGVGEEALTATIAAKDETVSKIEFLSDKAPIATGTSTTVAGSTYPDYEKISVSYKITNQYGENVNAAFESDVTFNPSKGSVTAEKGKLTLTSTNPYQINEIVVVTAVYSDNQTAVSATATLTVSAQSRVDKIEVTKVYNEAGKDLTTSSKFEDFYLIVDAYDQYGNVSTLNELNEQVSVFATNPTIFKIHDLKFVDGLGEEGDLVGLKLDAPDSTITFDGTNTVRFVTNFTGKTYNHDVVVGVGQDLYELTLNRPDQVVAAGDKPVKIPFTAIDKNGQPLTTIDAKQVNLSGGAKLGYDYVNKKSYIEWTVLGKGTHVVTAFVPSSNKFSQVQIKVEDAAVVSSVGNVKDLNRNIQAGAVQVIKADNVVVFDQHGREVEKDAAFFAKYSIKVTDAASASPKVAVNDTIDNKDDVVTLSAIAKGTEAVKFELVENGVAVKNSAFDFRVSVLNLSDIDSFEVADLPLIHATNANTHAVDLKVVGKRGNADVTVASSVYAVTTTNSDLTYADGKLTAAAGAAGTDANKTVDAKVIVQVGAATGPVTITKDVKVSNATPKVDTLKAEKAVVTLGTGDVATAFAKVFAELSAKDQYGKTISTTATDVSFVKLVSNFEGDLKAEHVDGNGTTTVGFKAGVTFKAGDAFQVTYTSNTGKSVTIKAVVE